jgi:hypothetical protein
VFAIVSQQIVSTFTQSRTGSPHDFTPIEPTGLQDLCTERAPLRELRDGDLFDQSLRILDATGVVHDPTVAKVDSMVGVAATRNDQVCPRDQLSMNLTLRLDHGRPSLLKNWSLPDLTGRGYRREMGEAFQRAYGIITVEITQRRRRPAARFN